jgi:hypothetical protein
MDECKDCGMGPAEVGKACAWCGGLGGLEGFAELSELGLVRKYTVADDLEDLCDLGDETGYRPSIYGSVEQDRLADAYDGCQAQRGDPRRAYRGYVPGLWSDGQDGAE